MVNVWGKIAPGAGAGGMYRKKAGQWQQIGVDPATAVNWAQVTGGTVTEYTKPDGSVMEVHTFTAAGSLTVVAAGYADVLLVSGGGGATSETGLGAGGRILSGLRPLPSGVQTVTVGQPGIGAGTPSVLGPLTTYYSPNYYGGAGATVAAGTSGFPSSITGTADDYGRSGVAIRANHGDGGAGNAQGSSGIVIVAVQKTPPTASGVVATGGTESTFTGDGTNGVLGQGYKVHTFTASGSLVVSAAPAGSVVECLIVAGGGGGDAGGGSGGGGAGGVIQATIPVSVGTLPVTVGAGSLTSGGESVFSFLLAMGGGKGGTGTGSPGKGGSGGGVGNTATAVPAGPGVAGQGNAGGAGTSGGAGAGGGGAGAAGSSPVAAGAVGGAGGAGVASLIGGTSVVYGGGGGGGGSTSGGAGGSGGGGTGGGNAANGTAGTANRGGGGGGAWTGAGAAGGSGIVAIRYKV